MSETSKTLRAIAHNYIKAAEHLEAAEWLAASVESSPHAAAAKTIADVEPMETIGDVAVGPRLADGWYWCQPPYPDEGSVGPFSSRESASRDARDCDTSQPGDEAASDEHVAVFAVVEGAAGPLLQLTPRRVEPTGERHPNIGSALDRCRDVLGWDPDTLSSVDACSAIAELMSLDELDCAEALEKRRVEMSPRRSSRSTVLTAIAKRRSELEAAGVQS